MKKFKIHKQKSKNLIGAVATGLTSGGIWAGAIAGVGNLSNISDISIIKIAAIPMAIGIIGIPITYHTFNEISTPIEDEDINKKIK